MTQLVRKLMIVIARPARLLECLVRVAAQPNLLVIRVNFFLMKLFGKLDVFIITNIIRNVFRIHSMRGIMILSHLGL